MGYRQVEVNGETWEYLVGNEFLKFKGPNRPEQIVAMWVFLGMSELEWRRKLAQDHFPPQAAGVTQAPRGMAISPGDVQLYIRRHT